MLDAFDYPTQAALAAAWIPMGADSPPPSIGAGLEGRAVVRFPCPFASLKEWRVSWDHEVHLDLSGVDRIVLHARPSDPAIIAQIAVYLKSGDGWYRMSAGPADGNGDRVELGTASAGIEGHPTGWQSIDRIRISILPGKRQDGFLELLRLDSMRGYDPEDVGRFGPFRDSHDALAALGLSAKGRATEADVRDRLHQTMALLDAMRSRNDPSRPETKADALRARRLLAEAYALVQDPRPGELRGFWGHNGDGLYVEHGPRTLSWADAMPLLAKNGFNAVFPNMLWSGVAFYPSHVVPTAPSVKERGDLLAQAISAAHANGIQVHLWKVMWQFAEGWLAPTGVSEPFRKQHRLQKNSKGEEQAWLCPSNPLNRKYELDAILEAARTHDVDGIHLDYIRYGGRDVCYCDVCRANFTKQRHRAVKSWPADAAPGGPLADEYADFKREQITSFVREVRIALKREKPAVKLSAAVFAEPETARETVSQDWPAWVREGLLDFVCTMTYTEDIGTFRNDVRRQLDVIDGKAPLYVGMYATYEPKRTQALEMSVEQIRSTRELGASGFVLFELQQHTLDDLLPYLGRGLTRP